MEFTEYNVFDKKYCTGNTNVFLEDSSFTLEDAKSACYADSSCKGFYHNQDTGFFVKCRHGYKEMESKKKNPSTLYLKGIEAI